jgi:hypothetical protein
MPAMTFKSLFDKDGVETKMAGRLGADGIFRPVHHSDVITLQVEVTRPANTTAYIAGDAIGAAADVKFQFDLAAAGVPAGLLVASRLIRNVVTNPTVRFRAGVHDALPATVPAADNDPAPQLYANRASRRGWVDYSVSMAGLAAGSDCLEYAGYLSSPQGIPVNPSNGILTLMLSTIDGFTPGSAEKFVLEIDLVA